MPKNDFDQISHSSPPPVCLKPGLPITLSDNTLVNLEASEHLEFYTSQRGLTDIIKQLKFT